ncbi:MAG: PilZ domain-containing protein [Candidatus Omnitrophica bacterium]|nr:PilZ domain-containing protein [Candidatus Omnitrophota bacterium]
MREKRRFIRFNIALKVLYVIRKEPREEKTGITKDVSAGGLELLTKEKMMPGSKMEITIYIPEALNPVHLNGTIVWSKETNGDEKSSYSTGVEFGKIEEDNKSTFLRFLCNLMYKRLGKKKGG